MKLWDAATGKEIATLMNGEGAGADAPAVPIYRLLAGRQDPGGRDRRQRRCNCATRRAAICGGPQRPRRQGNVPRLFARREALVTGGTDKTIKFWNRDSGERFATLHSHDGGVYAVAFSADGKLLASGDNDKMVRVWDAETGKELAALKGTTAGVRALAFAPDGKTLASGGRRPGNQLWNMPAYTEKILSMAMKGPFAPSAFSPDGKTLASASDDGMARLWGPDGKDVAILKGHAGEVVTLAFSPDGKHLVSGGADAKVRLWDAATGQPDGVLTGCSAAILCLTFAHDGRLAAACHDKTVKVWRPVKKTAGR